MMMIKKITTLFFCFLFFTSYSQKTEEEIRQLCLDGNEKELVKESTTLLNDTNLYLAEIIIDCLLEIKPKSANYNYRKGYILLTAKGDYLNAMPHLKIAITKTSNFYDMYSSTEESASTDAFYHLGKCYHLKGEYFRAEELYSTFLKKSSSQSTLINRAKANIQQCTNALQLTGNPKKVEIINLGKTINTNYPEYSPVISLDGTALYFTSRRPWENNESDLHRDALFNDYPEDVYVSYLNANDTWTEPKRMDFCRPERNEATITVSPDERRIYIYQDNVGGGDIFYSDFNKHKFREIHYLDNPDVNSEAWESHCAISIDGENLYFVSDREGGFGGRDIYRLVRLPNGEWSLPQNLGPKINTEFDEDSPFIAADNKTLYFSSNGPKSMGGFDVFVCLRDEYNNWSEPINLGYPVNSFGDDIFFTTTADGSKGYLTSSRDNGNGDKDIYEIKNDNLGLTNVTTLKGKIIPLKNQVIPEDITITIHCRDCGGYNDKIVLPRLRDNSFYSLLEPCREFEVSFVKDNEIFYQEIISTSCEKKHEDVYREIILDVDRLTILASNPLPSQPIIHEVKDKVEKSDTLIFENLTFKHYFAYNASKLSVYEGELKRYIEQITKQLEAGREEVIIQITSSASHVPTKTFKSNEKLAIRRAENIKEELTYYFERKTEYSSKVKIDIVRTIVDGPLYSKDSHNDFKYTPFQFIFLVTK
jgi:type II secretory pathway pseudopilin PulG